MINNHSTKICGNKHAWCTICNPLGGSRISATRRNSHTVNKCSTCGFESKDDSLFESNSSRPFRYRCRLCASAKTKAFADQRKKKIQEFKSRPCSDCGLEYDPECMDFDHILGEKLFNIGTNGSMFTHSWEEIELEIAKCEVVCSNCHRLRTKRRRNGRNI